MLNLKNTLLINAASSGAAGILLVTCASQVARLFAVQASWPFTATGLFLVAFAGLVFMAAARPGNAGLVRLVTTLDVLWVAASMALVLVDGASLSGLGVAAILAVAGWVALMALLQVKGLRALQSGRLASV